MPLWHLDVNFFERLNHLRQCEYCRTYVLPYERFMRLVHEIYGRPDGE
jgi:hypothetical protein